MNVFNGIKLYVFIDLYNSKNANWFSWIYLFL